MMALFRCVHPSAVLLQRFLLLALHVPRRGSVPVMWRPPLRIYALAALLSSSVKHP